MGAMDLTKIIEANTPLHFQNTPDFDMTYLTKRAIPHRIVQTSGKDYAIAQHKDDPSDCSDRTEYFDWHSDGLYHSIPPRFVLLHCYDPGNGQVRTDLASSFDVFADIGRENCGILASLRSHYIGHGGSYWHPILSEDGMLLASRGHVSAIEDIPLEYQPSVREISSALSALYKSLDAHAVSYKWKKGDTLIFDQYKYMHRRNSSTIDKDRRLARVWFR